MIRFKSVIAVLLFTALIGCSAHLVERPEGTRGQPSQTGRRTEAFLSAHIYISPWRGPNDRGAIANSYHGLFRVNEKQRSSAIPITPDLTSRDLFSRRPGARHARSVCQIFPWFGPAPSQANQPLAEPHQEQGIGRGRVFERRDRAH